jgi:hypothetical protein
LPKTICTTHTAEVVGDAVQPPVDLRARVLPGRKNRGDRALELDARILWERLPRLVGVDLLEVPGEGVEVVGRQLHVVADTALALQLCERRLEAMRLDALDDLAEHLDEAPVRVEREALVAGRRREPVDALAREAQVEDRVHHPGHRDRGARPHRD